MLTQRCGVAPRGWIPLLYGRKNFVFHVFYCEYDDWTNFRPLRELKKKSRAVFEDIYPGKGRFWVVLVAWLDRKFWNDTFWIPNQKSILDYLGFVAVLFDFREIPRSPSSPSSFHLKNNVCFGIHMRFLLHRTGQADTKNVWRLSFWQANRKNITLKFLVEPFRFAAPKHVPFHGNPAFFWRHGAAHREWISSLAHGTENVVFHIFYKHCHLRPNFRPLQKLETSHLLFSTTSIFGKGRLGSLIQNQKFQSKVFRIPHQERCTSNVFFSPIQFCAREAALGPKKRLVYIYFEEAERAEREKAWKQLVPTNSGVQWQCWLVFIGQLLHILTTEQ